MITESLRQNVYRTIMPMRNWFQSNIYFNTRGPFCGFLNTTVRLTINLGMHYSLSSDVLLDMMSIVIYCNSNMTNIPMISQMSKRISSSSSSSSLSLSLSLSIRVCGTGRVTWATGTEARNVLSALGATKGCSVACWNFQNRRAERDRRYLR